MGLPLPGKADVAKVSSLTELLLAARSPHALQFHVPSCPSHNLGSRTASHSAFRTREAENVLSDLIVCTPGVEGKGAGG